MSGNFHWVIVNRDYTPDITKRFRVSAHPSLAVIGPKEENIHRWSGFKEPAKVMPYFEEALARWKLYQEGKEWSLPTPRPASLLADPATPGLQELHLAPLWDHAVVPQGACFHKGELLVNVAGTCWTIDTTTATRTERYTLPPGTQDIASDGTNLWCLPGGWTKGDAITVINGADGSSIRTVATEANKKNRHSGAKGILWLRGKLYVFEGMAGKLHELDPATGEIRWSGTIGTNWCSGITFDGTYLITANRTRDGKELFFITPPDGATPPKIARRVKVNYWLRSLAADANAGNGILYAMEQPVRGFDKHHNPATIWPRETVIYQLSRKKE